MKAILIYPYDDNDPDTIRVALVDSDGEEQRLRATLQEYVAADLAYIDGSGPQPEPGSVSEFLEERGFTMAVSERLRWPFTG